MRVSAQTSCYIGRIAPAQLTKRPWCGQPRVANQERASAGEQHSDACDANQSEPATPHALGH
jgi:hypothetical protein